MNANESSQNTNRQPPDDDNADRRPPRSREEREARQARMRPGGNALAEVAKILRGGEGPDDQDQDDVDSPGGDDQDAQPKTRGTNGREPRQVKSLVDISKALGVPVEDLYNLEIPLRVANGDKKTIKLSELKDYRDQQDDHQLDRLAWSEEREREHADIARSRAELSELLAMVPEDKLKPDVLNKIRQRHEGMVTLERQRTLRRIPEWHDEGTRAEELELIANHLADYGFSANALQGIYDHRMLAYMRDNALRKRRLSAALEKVKPVRTETPARSRAAQRKPAAESVRTSTKGPRTLESQVSQVAAILRGE